jgi:hypothetical protein
MSRERYFGALWIVRLVPLLSTFCFTKVTIIVQDYVFRCPYVALRYHPANTSRLYVPFSSGYVRTAALNTSVDK